MFILKLDCDVNFLLCNKFLTSYRIKDWFHMLFRNVSFFNLALNYLKIISMKNFVENQILRSWYINIKIIQNTLAKVV